MSTEAQNIVPALYAETLQRVKQDSTYRRRAYRLAATRSDVVQSILSEMKTSPDDNRRLVAARALHLMGEVAAIHPGVIEALRDALKDANEGVRIFAVRTIAELGVKASTFPGVEAALLEAAGHSNREVAMYAIVALCPISDRPPVRAELKRIASDTSLPEPLRNEARGVLAERRSVIEILQELTEVVGRGIDRTGESLSRAFRIPDSLRALVQVNDRPYAIYSAAPTPDASSLLSGGPGDGQPFQWIYTNPKGAERDLVLATQDEALDGNVFLVYIPDPQQGQNDFAGLVALHPMRGSYVGRVRVQGVMGQPQFERLDPEAVTLADAPLIAMYRKLASSVDEAALPAWDTWLEDLSDDIRSVVMAEEASLSKGI